MPIKSNIILIHTGTNASIPTGYARETSLDAKFIKGAGSGSNPATSGGSATHTHTSATGAHTHTLTAHTHTVTFGTGSGADETGGSAGSAIVDTHTHTGSTITGTANGGLDAQTVTYSAVSNSPEYKDVIFIKSDGSKGIPANTALFSSTTARTGFNECDGTNGTADYRNKFLRGATASGDAGGTGGSTSNAHQIVHTHTVATHTHTVGASGNASGASRQSQSGGELIASSHTHTPTINAGTDVLNASPTITMDETVEPAYKKLMLIQNISGAEKQPVKGDIALYLGTLASIPSDWKIYSAMYDKYLKTASGAGEIASTGGANTHTHASKAHSHTGAHAHTAPNVTHGTQQYGTSGGGAYASFASTSHTVTIASNTTTYSDASTVGDSSSNEPEYVTVAFVEYQGDMGSSFLLTYLNMGGI